MLLLLVLTMVVSLIMGMGVPTTAAYLVLASLVAPTMIQLGIPPLAAHMFIFYFGCISSITPPVALAAYAGAGLAGCDPNKTGYKGSPAARRELGRVKARGQNRTLPTAQARSTWAAMVQASGLR